MHAKLGNGHTSLTKDIASLDHDLSIMCSPIMFVPQLRASQRLSTTGSPVLICLKIRPWLPHTHSTRLLSSTLSATFASAVLVVPCAFAPGMPPRG